MSIGYIFTHYKVILTMLITAIQFICSHGNNFSRIDVLIETLKNADKHARYDERLTFLCECRRSEIYPKFIQSLITDCHMEQWMHSIHFGTIFEAVVFRSSVTCVYLMFEKKLLNVSL